MRIFIITQDEPVYAPVYLAKIIQRARHSIVGITALSPAGNSGWVKLTRQRLAMYGPLDFIKAAALFAYCRLMDVLPTRRQNDRFFSMPRLAAHYSIPIYPCSNVNATAYIRILEGLELDILLSVAANQHFGPELLSVPRLACLNVHSALLPKYRGMDGLFWALVHGETQVGVTVHLMTEDFDEGAIVEQQPFEVAPDDTLHTLYFKAMDVGATLISQALEQFDAGTVITQPNEIDKGRYFSWPDRKAAQRFRENGRRFF
jgi:methionyl-tRNA formyltransferase